MRDFFFHFTTDIWERKNKEGNRKTFNLPLPLLQFETGVLVASAVFSFITTTVRTGALAKQGAKKPQNFQKSLRLSARRYSIFVPIMKGERQRFMLLLPLSAYVAGAGTLVIRRRIYAPFILTVDMGGWLRYRIIIS